MGKRIEEGVVAMQYNSFHSYEIVRVKTTRKLVSTGLLFHLRIVTDAFF